MAILKPLSPSGALESNPAAIKKFLHARGIIFEQWEASRPLQDDDDQETILEVYQEPLSCYMARHGFTNADVINVHPATPNLPQIRAKFLSEHTHDEDEVRFFVDGEGEFYFNLKGEVFSVLCQKGDFISVPKGITHWFDLAPKYHVKAIRVFQTKEGWVARYTESGIAQKYVR